jgi:ferredoxin
LNSQTVNLEEKMCESSGKDRIIIPPTQAVEIVGQAKNAYLRICPCRAEEQNCPPDTWEVCLLFDSASPDDLQDARPISTGEALFILKVTAGRKAIYNLFYTHADRIVTEICSCCTCCCHPLHHMQAEGNYREQLRSEYLAVTDTALCTGCGLCEESCFFEARWVEDNTLNFQEEQCFGCGRCIESCSEGAIRLVKEIGRGVLIPTAV